MDAAIESAPVATGVANAINQTPTNAMLLDILIRNISASMLLFALATTALAQEVRRESISLDQFNELRLVPVTISDREIVDYQVSGERSQILSVDLLTSNPANYFNILRAGSNQAVFIGSIGGTVADVPLPESGAYVIRVYLIRSAARWGDTARYSLGTSLGRPEFTDGLSGGKRWSVVIPATHTGVTGWVAGRYLVESAAPRRPAMAEGGPIGNGVPFDATGLVPCAACVGEPAALQVHSYFAYGWLS